MYRDLKPENILLDSEGHIKIIDFGLSTTEINSEKRCGTPEFMAPEIINGIKYSKEVDFWALGILIFEMVTGKVPYSKEDEQEVYKNTLENPVNIPNSFSKNLKLLLENLLIINPENRLIDIN